MGRAVSTKWSARKVICDHEFEMMTLLLAQEQGLAGAGLNWHVNRYIKIMFDWQHADFNNPVLFSPGRRQLTSDMFMVRFQVCF
jgi:hypothetical protein